MTHAADDSIGTAALALVVPRCWPSHRRRAPPIPCRSARSTPRRPISGRCISRIKNGYFDAADIKIDLVFAQSNASVIQQLAAGSYNIAPSAGMVDPIRAIDKGAPVALVRIVIQAPPYALLAKPEIKSIEDLKGKTIIIGGAKDITRIFTERMLAPHGLKSGDYDYVFAGATSARFSALKSGAVDAALLTMPFNFFAETAGYTNLGFTFDVSARHAVRRHGGEPRPGRKPIPTCSSVSSTPTIKALPGSMIRPTAKPPSSCRWTSARSSRTTWKRPMRSSTTRTCSSRPARFPSGRSATVIDALRDLGDLPADFTVDRLLLPGVTQISD